MTKPQCLWTMLPLLLTLGPAPASGQTITNLASLPVFFTCLAQEPDLREGFMRRLRDTDDPAEARWETMLKDSSWAACVRQKKWVSKVYCSDLFEASLKGSRQDVARVMQKHWSEYQGLKPMVDYFQAQKDDAGAPARVPCPE